MKALFTLAALCIALASLAQESLKPLSSPLSVSTTKYKDTYVKVVYSRPDKKGRQIFGSLVPYGQVWRLGANEATEITLTRDVKVNGSDLKAGSYSMFAIPDKDKWTIIFNIDLGLWGAYNYNQKMDVLRVEAPVITLQDVVYEPFSMWFDPKNDKADLFMAWDKTKIALTFQFFEPKQ